MGIVVKIFVFLISIVVLMPIAYFFYIFMLIAMNGYTSVGWAQPVFWGWAILSSLICGVLAAVSTHLLENKKKLNVIIAGIISLTIFLIVGAVLSGVGMVLGIFARETQRNL